MKFETMINNVINDDCLMAMKDIPDNVIDMIVKKRSQNHTCPERHPKGEKVGGAKLTASQVMAIRKRKGESPTKIGLEFGVSATSIIDIWNHRTWKHI